MNRPFLFLAGEYNVTMPVVFEFDDWGHTMTSKRLVITDGRLHRENVPNEDIKGLIYLARVEDVSIEYHNLKIIKESGVPCWPPVDTLQFMTSRHSVMAECYRAGLNTDPGWVLHYGLCVGEYLDAPDSSKMASNTYHGPFVAKVGEAHCGQDKFLLKNRAEMSEFIKNHPHGEPMTMERFYEGLSVRVLFIGDEVFGVQYHNDQSWIKNDVGCEYDDWDPPQELVIHAKRVKDHFGLELAGVDYVIEPNGTFHFLEINQFPGLRINERSIEVSKSFLRTKIKLLSGHQP